MFSSNEGVVSDSGTERDRKSAVIKKDGAISKDRMGDSPQRVIRTHITGVNLVEVFFNELLLFVWWHSVFKNP